MLVAIDRNPLCACKSIFKSPAFNVRVRVQGPSAGAVQGAPPSLPEDDPGYTTGADGQEKAHTKNKNKKKGKRWISRETKVSVWDAEKDLQPKVCVSTRWGCVGWAPDISQDFWWVSASRHLGLPRPRRSWPHLSGNGGLPKSRH